MSGIGNKPEIFHAAEEALRRAGKSGEELSWRLLAAVTDAPDTIQPVLDLKAESGLQGDELERLLVWYAVHQALPRLETLSVHSSVRVLLEKELRKLLAPSVDIEAGSYNFRWAAKIATLRRFPAGPLDWEISGIARSWLLKPKFPDNLRLIWFVARRLRGHYPCFFTHVAPKPRNRALVIEKEVLRSYYRIVRSLELQPGVRAVVAHAWFHDPVALRENPHLDSLNQPFLEHGGIIATVEPAPATAGFLEGNTHRQREYEAGRLQYQIGLAIWPRRAAINWARSRTDLET